MTDWRIPLSMLDYGVEEADAVRRVIASQWLSMEPEVIAFEREFAAMQSAAHELHAALGRSQLAKLLDSNARRRRVLARYRAGLQGDQRWTMVFADQIEHSSGHLMVAVAASPDMRARAAHALHESGIQWP